MSVLLAGDVGGTKTKLGLFPLDNPSTPIAEATFASAQYRDLESVIREFLKQNRAEIKYASFGVAGPVIEGEARITNLSWVIQEKALARMLNLPGAHLLNDVEAIATSVPFLGRSDAFTLNHGEPLSKGARAIIAPGTGLGEAFITQDASRDDRHTVHPSEGGHADFAPADESKVELLRYLLRKFDHVSCEDVCSGIGIRNIHEYFDHSNPGGIGSWHKNVEVGDPVPLMAAAALDKHERCENCSRTFETFISILGAEAGNIALKVLATGGVYLGGGIPRKILPLLEGKTFMASFTNKGRLSEMLSRFPVHVITNPHAALLGAARSGMDQIQLHNPRLAQEV